MANYATLKAAITAAIKENGNNEITGALLQQQLLAMVNSLGSGYQYAGIATPETNPGTPDQNVFYLASTVGTYANFGSLVLADGEIAILKYNGAWSKDSTGAASLEKVNQLGQKVEQFPSPTYLCFSAVGTDHADAIGQWVSIYGGTSGEMNASPFYKAFLDLHLSGFDTTKNIVLSLIRNGYGAGATDYQIRFAEYSGSRTNEITFNVTSSDISQVGGVNKISATSSDGNHKIQAVIDYSTMPANCSTSLPTSNNFKVAAWCFGNLQEDVSDLQEDVSDLQTGVADLQNNAVTDSDITIERVSNNLANPANIQNGKLISDGGGIATNASWDMIGIPVTPGQEITFGGFYLGRTGYYAFYNGNTLVSTNGYNDPNGRQNPVTVTVPASATILYIDIRSGSSPSDPYANLMVNVGPVLLDYDVYAEAVTKINGVKVAGEDSQGSFQSLIEDLPLSADGSGIATGYAYINSSTGVITVKQ